MLDGIAGRIGVDAPHLGPDAPRPGAPSRTGSALFDLLIDALRFYFEFHADHGCGYLAQVHDLLAAEVAVGEPLGARAEALWVGVETGAGITRGTTVADVRRLLGRAPSARVLTDVDPAAAIDALVRAVVSLSARGGGAGTGRGASAVAEGLAT